MRGDIVVVRAFKGRPYVRRVWESSPDAVYICSEERFQKLAENQDAWPPTGFPREDVFCYDPSLVDVLRDNWHEDQSLWNRLTIWQEDQQN